MPKNPIPIVIFGAGSIVSDAHLPAYKLSKLPVKGIYDPDYEKAKKLGQIYGIKVFKEASYYGMRLLYSSTERLLGTFF